MDSVGSSRSTRNKRAATSNSANLWSNGIVPFEFAYNYSGIFLQMIYESMYMWTERSCVFFTERTSLHKSWLRIAPGLCGCCSQVGLQTKGAQYIHISNECDRPGIIAHEFGHALGFWHEHTRPDRDDHVYILEDNIEEEQFYNFEKKSFDEIDSLGEPYDPESIMHYGPDTFSESNGAFTILLKYTTGMIYHHSDFLKAMGKLGQRIRPSNGDISQINKLYRCPPCGGNLILNSTENWITVEPKENIVHCKYCRWRVTTSYGNKIKLKIDVINLYPGQFAIIYDGPERDYSLIGYINGQQQMFRPSLISQRTSVYVELWGSNIHGYEALDAKFKISAKAVCGGSLTRPTGILTNPTFPYPIANSSLYCSWVITTDEDKIIFLKLNRVLLRDNGMKKATLLILDGENKRPLVLKKLSNVNIGDMFLSVRSRTHSIQVNLKVMNTAVGLIWIEYFSQTDPCKHENGGCQQICQPLDDGYKCSCDIGYRLSADRKSCVSYKSIDRVMNKAMISMNIESCKRFIQLTLKLSRGRIKYPHPMQKTHLYNDKRDCFWMLLAPSDKRIEIKFLFMEIEGMLGSCNFDRLRIKDVFNSRRKHGQLKEFCGNKLPKNYVSTSNIVNITFTSDETNAGRGFLLEYFLI
ncbi:hypothetical protein GJ496_001429 [Pomphorhynchus laevis]|nr:hypothetical protein GJ496_001429 [Pomphorhynchus laevis]